MTQQSVPQKKDSRTRIARMMLPMIKDDSALLPPDKWFLTTLKEIVKTNHNLRRDLAIAGALTVATLVGVIGVAAVGIAAAMSGAAATAWMLGAGAMMVGGTVGLVGRAAFLRFKKETIPQVKEEIGKSYFKLKADEMKNAWQQRVAARKEAKAATAPKANDNVPEVKAEVAPVKNAKPSLIDFGKWAMKKPATEKPTKADAPDIAGKKSAPKGP